MQKLQDVPFLDEVFDAEKKVARLITFGQRCKFFCSDQKIPFTPTEIWACVVILYILSPHPRQCAVIHPTSIEQDWPATVYVVPDQPIE